MVSRSQYIYASTDDAGLKIRIADHPPRSSAHSRYADIEIGNHQDADFLTASQAAAYIVQRLEVAPDAALKRIITRIKRQEAEQVMRRKAQAELKAQRITADRQIIEARAHFMRWAADKFEPPCLQGKGASVRKKKRKAHRKKLKALFFAETGIKL